VVFGKRCTTLHHTATHCNALQRTATPFNTCGQYRERRVSGTNARESARVRTHAHEHSLVCVCEYTHTQDMCESVLRETTARCIDKVASPCTTPQRTATACNKCGQYRGRRVSGITARKSARVRRHAYAHSRVCLCVITQRVCVCVS